MNDDDISSYWDLQIPHYDSLTQLVMDREAWRAAIHGVAKIWTGLND